MASVGAGACESGGYTRQSWWHSGERVRDVGKWSAFATALVFVAGTISFGLEGRWPGMGAYASGFSDADLLPWVFFALILLATLMGFQRSGRFPFSLGATYVWAAILTVAMVLLGIAFHRRLLVLPGNSPPHPEPGQ